MNLILLFKDDFIDGTQIVRLSGRRLRHVTEVHRASQGERLCVGLEGGQAGTGLITRLDGKVLEMDVELTQAPPEPLPISLILALPRPKVISRVILALSSMGVKKIILLNAYRVEKSFWQSPRLSPENISDQLILGLEQAKDTLMPEIVIRKRFKPFVEDELPDIVKGTTPLVAHPGSEISCPRDIKTPVTLAVGPEGGFIPYEVEKLVEAGFTPVHMGERILRVETAIPALLSRLF